MRLDEIRQLVMMSLPQDWHRIAGGPSYRDRSIVTERRDADGDRHDGDKHTELNVTGHDEFMVLRVDVDISIAWGMDVDIDPEDRGLRVEGWANKLELPKPPRLFFADTFYRGALVDRDLLCHAGDVCLPLPDPAGIADELQPKTDGLCYRYRASRRHIALARLIYDLSYPGSCSFDAALDTAGIRPDDEPDAAFVH
jgi:hypothetical protein